MKGRDLIHQVCSSTDIAENLLTAELKTMISDRNMSEDSLTLDQLRDVLAEYLQDILLEIKQEVS